MCLSKIGDSAQWSSVFCPIGHFLLFINIFFKSLSHCLVNVGTLYFWGDFSVKAQFQLNLILTVKGPLFCTILFSFIYEYSYLIGSIKVFELGISKLA